MIFDEFKSLVKQAANETRHLSGSQEEHPNIQRLLGEEWPLAWACLMLEDDSIFQAFFLLGARVPAEKQPPFPEYYQGRVPVLVECYRYWALKEEYVSVKYDPTAYWVEDSEGNRGDWH